MKAIKVRYMCLKAATPMAADPETAMRYASVFELFVVCGYTAGHEALLAATGRLPEPEPAEIEPDEPLPGEAASTSTEPLH